MKPLYLEIQAFGPYVEKQTVDFEKLGRQGIFLIKGNTGSGKTTIFDAMTFALYGGGSGDGEKTRTGRNDLEEWRCTQAGADLDTIVTFVFSTHGHKYRFSRSLSQKRKNLTPKYEAGELDDEGNVIPFFNNPKKEDLNGKAVELIGLTKEQFRQVVLLPQGQFEKFLTAPSNEKEDILRKIFGSEQWAAYAQSFFDEAAERKKMLDNEKADIDRSLAEEKVTTLEELEERIAALDSQRKTLEQAHKAFDGEKKQAELNDDIKLSEQFRPLHELEKAIEELLEKKADVDAKRRACGEAERAEKVRSPLDAFEKAERDKNGRSAELSKLKGSQPDVQRKKEDAERAKKKHDESSPIEKLNQDIGLYESKKDAYSSLDALKKKLDAADREHKTALAESENAEAALESAAAEAKAKKEQFDAADRTARDHRDRYYAGIYGEIASELREGEKCPVCGSIRHPEPAEKHPDSVGKDELDRAEKRADSAKNVWNTAEQSRENAQTERDRKKAASDRAKEAYTEARTAYNSAAESLIEGIPDRTALDVKIHTAQRNIREYEEARKLLQSAVDKACGELSSLNGKIETAEKELSDASETYEKAKRELDEALRINGFADAPSVRRSLMSADARKKLNEEIVQYGSTLEGRKKDLADQMNALTGKREPDAFRFPERQKAIKEESDTYQDQTSEIKTKKERLAVKLTRLQEKKADYDSKIGQAESDLAFARKLRGDSGIGLQRYVLAIMFNQVIGEANRMLSRVHGGRYRLFRTDDKAAGNKRGLELKVHDSRSPEKDGRSVAMLSGGEKFLVSLALSIGMSTVAQKSGVQIEALFIDEGFGTLDDSSIQDAMDVLDNVRKGSGMIGIISHVQLLEANIPTHLEVIKSESGSRIAVV